MSTRQCSNCGCELGHAISHRYDDDYYCTDCFHENFNYCTHCDEAIHAEDTYWDDDYAYCRVCHRERTADDDAPQNPAVNNKDRELIIELSKNWLEGKVVNQKRIHIKKNDYRLDELREKVGCIDKCIYVYGLTDRDGYQIKAGSKIFDEVRDILNDINLEASVIEDDDSNRLGISYSLRKDHFDQIIDLVKQLTTNLVPAI